ncbi:DUF2264 domain-containing protein [Streptomyces cheonanensis]|uniref:DUF2264 domain-containing protein n=1 Tax=Streptomyces cheonanensis TaxID=312720 RepID=A0ABN2UXV3_9ACTN
MAKHPFTLPDEDRALSPHTGWTRAHWEAVADGLLHAVAPYATGGRALYHLPGGPPSGSGPRSDGLEGYARTFLLAAFRVAGAGGADPQGFLERYAAGLDAGTRTPGGAGPEDWPLITDRSQPLVEAASIALALRLTRPWLWDRLPGAVRERAVRWLSDALTAQAWECNWELFPVTVGGFLAETGEAGETRAAAEAAIARGLDRIEPWYRGAGWYSDGPARHFDYYNGWAMHLYPVLHAWQSGDPAALERYGDRLAVHLADYARLFGGDGAPLHQGRSLTYRMATTAPLWLGALTGRTPLAPGVTRRLASGALRYFLDRGAVGPEGLLSLGWHGPYRGVLQRYSGPASPYWASKAFTGLLLPAEHPVWTATEEPGPAERADAVTALPVPGWLLQSTASDGVVRLHNHGSEDARYDPHYTRSGYSTVTGPTPVDAGPAADNHFGPLLDGSWAARSAIEPLGAGDGWIASAHDAGGQRVVSVVLAHGAAEVRIHLMIDSAPGTPVRLTGWAAGEGLHSELHPVHGYTADGSLSGLSTAFTTDARVPVLTGRTGEAPGDRLFISLARLTGDNAPPPLSSLAGVRVTTPAAGTADAAAPDPEAATRITVEWTDGPRRHLRITSRAVRAD